MNYKKAFLNNIFNNYIDIFKEKGFNQKHFFDNTFKFSEFSISYGTNEFFKYFVYLKNEEKNTFHFIAFHEYNEFTIEKAPRGKFFEDNNLKFYIDPNNIREEDFSFKRFKGEYFEYSNGDIKLNLNIDNIYFINNKSFQKTFFIHNFLYEMSHKSVTIENIINTAILFSKVNNKQICKILGILIAAMYTENRTKLKINDDFLRECSYPFLFFSERLYELNNSSYLNEYMFLKNSNNEEDYSEILSYFGKNFFYVILLFLDKNVFKRALKSKEFFFEQFYEDIIAFLPKLKAELTERRNSNNLFWEQRNLGFEQNNY